MTKQKQTLSLLSLLKEVDQDKEPQQKIQKLLKAMQSIATVEEVFFQEIIENLNGQLKTLTDYPQSLKNHPSFQALVPFHLDMDKTLFWFFQPLTNLPPAALYIQFKETTALEKEIDENLYLLISKFQDIHQLYSLQQSNGEGHFKQFWYEEAGILDKLNLPFFASDSNGNVFLANKAFLEISQLKSIADINTKGGLDKILHQDKSEQGKNHYLLNQNQEEHPVLLYSLQEQDKNYGILFDNSEMYQAQKEMQQSIEIQELLNDQLISSTLSMEKAQTVSVKTLARLAEYRDRETGYHLQRISDYTEVLVQELYKDQPYSYEITRQYVKDTPLSSMLHDIGKVAVSDVILLKEGPLSETEWDIMKSHTVWGWQLLSDADQEMGFQSFLSLAQMIVHYHHEKWDGSGYPSGLQGEEIPLSARIVSLADFYDAVTSIRPYKGAWTHQESIDEIKKQRGKHFDPIIVDTFMRMEKRFHEIRNSYQDK